MSAQATSELCGWSTCSTARAGGWSRSTCGAPMAGVGVPASGVSASTEADGSLVGPLSGRVLVALDLGWLLPRERDQVLLGKGSSTQVVGQRGPRGPAARTVLEDEVAARADADGEHALV